MSKWLVVGWSVVGGFNKTRPCLQLCIIISSGFCVLAFILVLSYCQVHVCLLVSSHPHILVYSGSESLLVCSHPQVNVFSIQMKDCFLAYSSSLALGNSVRHVNN